jgi:uncharacterized protein
MRRLLIALVTIPWVSGCVGLFFQPYGKYVRTPAEIGLTFEDVAIKTQDDLELHAWLLPAEDPECGTILFLHGNAENISTHIASVHWLPARGFNVLLLDYRGYGSSDGQPSIAGLQTDIDAAVRYLLARAGAVDSGLVLFGQSLGAAAGIYYAAHGPHRGRLHALVADSSFSSYRGIAREKMANFWLTWPFQWIPLFTVPTDYDPIAAVSGVSPVPLLLVHGDDDRVIPLAHSERLFAAAREPKQFWEVEGVGHIEAFRSPKMRDRLVNYLRANLCPTLSGTSD